MNFCALCILILMIEPSLSQFPQHTDFQKVGEIILNNEKYKILKPVTHYIGDYFRDFMLSKNGANFPTKRLFIDDNSFRHYWSGFDRKSLSLRKTDLPQMVDGIKDDPQDKVSIKNLIHGKGQLSAKTSGTPEDDINIRTSTFTGVEKSKRNSASSKPNLRAENKERTVAKTTFFCPFIGVISMSAFID